MAKANGFILKLSRKRRAAFEDAFEFDGYFAEPVDSFSHSRTAALTCFICNESGQITHIAKGRKGLRAGTDLIRLNCNDIVELERAVSPDAIVNLAKPRLRRWIESKLDEGGLFSPKAFANFIDIFISVSPESRRLLARYGRENRNRLKRLTPQERTNLASQKESIATALAISDIKRDDLRNWMLDSDDKPTSFLNGLQVARLREDPMVVNDLMVLPGHEYVETLPYGAAIFEGDQSHLTVILANRQPLEKQTGTDLIYFNETFQAFIMVQYKAMEQEAREAVYRFPNDQLTEEIKRMDSILLELAKVKSDTSRDGFRLNQNPFFLKFCPRLLFNPDDIGLVPGMYLSLDYWKLCAADPATTGPKGGKKLTYRNVGRYLNNTSFVQIVSQAWVGTTITQSKILKRLIRETIETGKAVTIAIKRDDRDPPDDDGQTVVNPITDGAFIEEYEPPARQTVTLKV